VSVFKAVIWDFGGVITSSPFEAFNRYEAERGLPRDTIRRINSINPDTNAWSKIERAEIDGEGFDRLFAEEARALGCDIPGRAVLSLLSGDVRPRMVAALDHCKRAGLKLGCITNNVPTGAGDETLARSPAMAAMTRFDVIIESSKAGVRKPDPRIYAMMCEALAVDPQACVYLDDLGINCKPAAAMGMTAIKVTGEAQALAALQDALGMEVS
jgi:putative hydrolase of the HAD superfamily